MKYCIIFQFPIYEEGNSYLENFLEIGKISLKFRFHSVLTNEERLEIIKHKKNCYQYLCKASNKSKQNQNASVDINKNFIYYLEFSRP